MNFQGLYANIPLFITTFYFRLPDLPGPLLYNQCLPNIFLKQILFSSDIITAFLEDLLMIVKLSIKNKIYLVNTQELLKKMIKFQDNKFR